MGKREELVEVVSMMIVEAPEGTAPWQLASDIVNRILAELNITLAPIIGEAK